MLALAAASAGAGREAFDTATARRVAETALHGRSLDYATELTTTIGARVTGSRSYQRAVAWAIDRFIAAGAATAVRAPFTIARGWERAFPATGRIVAPVQQTLRIASLGWSPSTPEEGVEARLVAGDDALGRAPESARGRIVMMTGRVPPDFDRTLMAAGALALLFQDPDAEDGLTARVRGYGGDIAPLPSATIARSDALLLRRLMAGGPVRIALALPNATTTDRVAVDNVIAELRGRDRPEEFVIVGAHLDSWDAGTGAQDNAAGVAMVLEAARAIAAAGRPPRRSIRFALWGGEEQGLLGSAAYAAAREDELDRCVAVLNADGGTGRIIGWTTPGREDVRAQVGGIARALLGELRTSAVDSSMQYAFDSDGGVFVRLGIPTLDLNVDDTAYEAVHHKAADTMERLNPRNLAVGAATVAATAYAIADAPGRLAPRGPKLGEP